MTQSRSSSTQQRSSLMPCLNEAETLASCIKKAPRFSSDNTVRSEFRARLVSKDADRLLLDTLLERLRTLGLIKQRGKQRTDSTYVLAAVRRLNRLERVG